MASLGLNVVLISRTHSKLQQVAEEISIIYVQSKVIFQFIMWYNFLIWEHEYPQVQTRTIAVDFTDGQSIYPKLRTELANLTIGILINNVGMEINGPFVAIEQEEKLRDIINCNVCYFFI